MCMDFTISGGMLWNLSLKGLSSATLISCFAKSLQPNSPVSREKMSWYSANRTQASAWFLTDHLSRPDKSSCWKSSFFLCWTIILVCWIPCISSNFPRNVGGYFHGGMAFATTTWVTLMPLAIVIGTGIRFFTTTATHLLPEITGVLVQHTQTTRQVRSITPFQGLSLYMHVVSQEQGFCSAVYYFGWKKHPLVPSLLFLLPGLSWLGPQFWFATVFHWIKSPACCQANNQAIFDPFRETWQLIDFTFIDHIDDPIDGGCTQSNWYLGPKASRVRNH